MSALRLSVLIVSRGRPALLARALTALDQTRGIDPELVVVADAAGLAATAPWAGRLKATRFDAPNISAARNVAAGLAAGEVLAFLDDDAVPEPTWAARIAGAFAAPGADLAATTLLGPDGIRPQYGLRAVGPDGTSFDITAPEGPALLPGTAARAIRTEGASMAIRREVLSDFGGFDPGFRFYMDETDLNLRAGAAGLATAWVPEAVAHHGLAPSGTRLPNRAPRSLHEVAASVAVLSRRHGGEARAMLEALRAEQRRRLARHLVAGRIEPRDMARMLSEVEAGWAEGLARPLAPLAPLPAPPALLAFGPRVTGAPAFLWGRRLAPLRAEAAALLSGGRPVSILALSRGRARHRVAFRAGIWEQTGGQRGRSAPGLAAGAFESAEARAHAEAARVAGPRDLAGGGVSPVV